MSEQQEESCIEGMKCVCGNTAKFLIYAVARCTVEARGVTDAESFEWDDESGVQCPECGVSDTMASFVKKNEAAA